MTPTGWLMSCWLRWNTYVAMIHWVASRLWSGNCENPTVFPASTPRGMHRSCCPGHTPIPFFYACGHWCWTSEGRMAKTRESPNGQPISPGVWGSAPSGDDDAFPISANTFEEQFGEKILQTL